MKICESIEKLTGLIRIMLQSHQQRCCVIVWILYTKRRVFNYFCIFTRAECACKMLIEAKQE